MNHDQSKFQPPEKGHEGNQKKENPTAGTPITDRSDNAKQKMVKQRDALRSFKLTKEGQNSFTLVNEFQEIRDQRPPRSSNDHDSLQAKILQSMEEKNPEPLTSENVTNSPQNEHTFVRVNVEQSQQNTPLSDTVKDWLSQFRTQPALSPDVNNTVMSADLLTYNADRSDDFYPSPAVDRNQNFHPEVIPSLTEIALNDRAEPRAPENVGIPTTKAEWEQRLKSYENLSKEELATKLMSVGSDQVESLIVAVAYAYKLRERGNQSMSDFAEKCAPDMMKRAEAYKLPLNESEIDAEKIKQAFPDDCTLMSPIIAMARTKEGREKLIQMVHKNDDGTYTVDFPGHKPSVLVKGLTLGEKMIGSSSDGNILVSLIEKAYGQVLNEGLNPKLSIAAEATKIGLNKFSQALEFLTGSSVEEVLTAKRGNLLANEADFANKVQAAQREHRVVIAGTIGDIPDHAVAQLGIHKGHAYEISYDPVKRDFIVRDPLQSPHKDIHLSWDQFNGNFSNILIERKH